MSAHAVSMELSVSFVSWINEQLREEIEARQPASRELNFFRSFLCAGVASISIVLGVLIAY